MYIYIKMIKRWDERKKDTTQSIQMNNLLKDTFNWPANQQTWEDA